MYKKLKIIYWFIIIFYLVISSKMYIIPKIIKNFPNFTKFS